MVAIIWGSTICILLLPGKRSKSPGTLDRALLLRTSAAFVENVSKLTFTHWHKLSVSPFVQELPSAISFSRSNLVTNNFSSFARGETIRPPLKMSDTKSFTLVLAKDGYWLCPLRCRMFLMLPMLQYPIAKVIFSIRSIYAVPSIVLVT